MNAAERVLSLRQEVNKKMAELHALQYELLSAERVHREEAMRNLSMPGMHTGMVLQQGAAIPAALHGGFPTSKSGIEGDRSAGVAMHGSVRLVPDQGMTFRVPAGFQIASKPLSPATGESDKGPALVQLFG